MLFQLSYVPERGSIVRAARDQDLTGLPSRMPDVRLATAADIGPMAASLSKAFADDPLMAYLMGEELSYDKGVKFFSLMTKIQVPQNHTYVTDNCEAAAVWAPPDKWKVPPLEIAKATPGFLSVFGAKRFVSALSTLSVLEKAHPKEPHYYLEFLGTDPAHQRKGLGAAVLEPVLAKCDAEGLGAYLESSKDVNVPYYRHFGFEVRQEIEHKNNGPKQWLMWRDPK